MSIFNYKVLSLISLLAFNISRVAAQQLTLKIAVITELGKSISGAAINIRGTQLHLKTNADGFTLYQHDKVDTLNFTVSALGFEKGSFNLVMEKDSTVFFTLYERKEHLNEVVISGTQKETRRLNSPIPVEIYTQQFFHRNPTPSVFDALQNINGIRPQLNCNICNTGDIHINGLEGSYTMVLIDGLPMVSSLSTVYGLSGIPNALIDRVEVVKGPASSLYGSEAVGGLINIITKQVDKAAKISVDLMSTSYAEHSLDVGHLLNLGEKISALTGVSYFKYGHKVDGNHDGFTDITLQDRLSVFQKWSIKRRSNRLFSVATRFLYEDRWGGQMNWQKAHRGGNLVYGESIYTKRFELFGNYQLPVEPKMNFIFSFTNHNQDSRYGETVYIANQKIGFGQLTLDKVLKKHSLLFGTAMRYTYYDDNTPATFNSKHTGKNAPENTFLPGVFAQNELTFDRKNTLLLGLRYDYNASHGHIFTPRLAYKHNFTDQAILRINAGTGFRVVNLFTEDHAALTGARTVVIANALRPERSYNLNVNLLKRDYSTAGHIFTYDVSAFYTHFSNRIVADYETNTNEINYGNLNGYAVSRGVSGSLDAELNRRLKLNAGLTLQDVSTVIEGNRVQQMLTERWMGVWSVSYDLERLNLLIDYTGNVYGKMRLPLLNALDPRKANSPVWSVQNIQFSYKGFKRVELYSGIKNILNFKPTKNNSFLIARANDPFDKAVQFDNSGTAIPTPDNPYGLTFDPTYMYAPNQGARAFFGLRYTVR